MCALCSVPSTLSALSCSVLTGGLFISSLTVGEIATERSQVICSRSYPYLDGEPATGPWQFHFGFYVLDHFPVKQRRGGEEQNLGGCLEVHSANIHSTRTCQAPLSVRHYFRHQGPSENPCIPSYGVSILFGGGWGEKGGNWFCRMSWNIYSTNIMPCFRKTHAALI